MPGFLYRSGRISLYGAPKGIGPFQIERAVGTEVMPRSVKIVHKRLTIGVKMLVDYAARALDSTY